MSALRAAVQLVLGLHDRSVAIGNPQADQLFLEHGWMVRLDPMAEAQLRRALESEPEFPWDDGDITVHLTWSHPVKNGGGHHMGSGGETTESLTPAGLIDLIKNGRRDIDGLDVTSITVFTATREDPKVVDLDSLRALQNAANGLNYNEFCDALGWDKNDYSKDKFLLFQSLGVLGRFDGAVLKQVIGAYLDGEARRAHPPA